MIDLTRRRSAGPHIHTVDVEPGLVWHKSTRVAIDAPPDADPIPDPQSIWNPQLPRTGICGAVGPRVISFAGGGFRLYYTQILPRQGFPRGANDYDNCTARILSAVSSDGSIWTPEPGVRLSPQVAGAGEFRVVSSEVVPVGNGDELRMYYECCPGTQAVPNSIRSAISKDGGLTWQPELGCRVELPGRNLAAPRLIYLTVSDCRLYFYDRGIGIRSARSIDGGLHFAVEEGIRIPQDSPFDVHAAFAPEILALSTGGYVMYYAGYSQTNRAQILRAVSGDGLTWTKESQPVISPSPHHWDAAKSSEMCVIRLPTTEMGTHYSMLYEACDGSAENARGVWRIACATTRSPETSPA